MGKRILNTNFNARNQKEDTFLGLYLNKYLMENIRLYALVNEVSVSHVVRSILHEWKLQSFAYANEAKCIDKISTKIIKRWRDANPRPPVDDFCERLTKELQQKGVSKKHILLITMKIQKHTEICKEK